MHGFLLKCKEYQRTNQNRRKNDKNMELELYINKTNKYCFLMNNGRDPGQMAT